MASSTSVLDQYHSQNPNDTSTVYPGDPGVEDFSTTGPGFAGDKANDFAGATGGTDQFSETPNSKSIDQFEKENGGGDQKGALKKIKDALHIK
ncbi:hypothetical protein [Phaffia rhodozyma]|uniref:Uncharacterized protein n=1 Tax=Phaffia rhodozyma TaxID=264483 RepID=A0A0F7SXW0_PHARH|nr:hypothetical protein [Phaffia rhodozyma]